MISLAARRDIERDRSIWSEQNWLRSDGFDEKWRNNTPVFGLVFSSVLSSVVLVMNYNKGLVEQFTFIILLATLNTLVPYVFCSLSEIMMVVKGSKRVERGSFTGLTVLSLAAFTFSLWAIAGAGPEIVYWGFLLLMSGVPVYVWIQHNRSSTIGRDEAF